MKNYLKIASLALVPFIFSGCLGPNATPVMGVYTNVTVPKYITSQKRGTKVGQAQCKSIMFFSAEGDCSIKAAQKDGNITNITHVDAKAKSVLGLYNTYTVIVYGE